MDATPTAQTPEPLRSAGTVESKAKEYIDLANRCAGIARNPGDRGVWSMGDPLNPTRDDAMSGTEAATHANAKAMSSDERIVAVWHGSDCVALYWSGRCWKPA